MEYQRELNFLRKILDKYHIENKVIETGELIYDKIGTVFSQIMDKKIIGKTFNDFFPEIKSNAVYQGRDDFQLQYIIMKLEENKAFVIGPYLEEDITEQQIMEMAEKFNLSSEVEKELGFFYSSVPVVKDENFLLAAVYSLAETVFEDFECIELNRENSTAIMSDDLKPERNDENIISIMEKRYSYENELMLLVSQGNFHKAQLMLANFSSLAFEKRISDPLRNMKNYCIVMNTLFRKAAENGGVHPIYLDSVSSGFARRTENIHALNMIPEFMLEILETYCNLVKQHSVKNYSPIIQRAIIKIEADLTSDLSLKEMAKLANVSSGYFSALFKKETGMSLTQFVNNRRIKYAQNLLRTTNLQVQTVAQHCGILDFHYFCRMFKTVTGKTPTEYKETTLY